MASISPPRATLDDLHRVEGKAELIGGKVVSFMASGFLPAIVAGRIFRSLDDHAIQVGSGVAFSDGIGFAILELPSGRESFSPDASYYLGPLPTNLMRFIEGAPTFAVEVRSDNDYGDAAEAEMAAKREDYFQAGTAVVWDVDPQARTIVAYPGATPTSPLIFRAGDQAHAEPAVPGWRVAVDWIFR